MMRLKLERTESGQSHVPQFSHEVARKVNQIRDDPLVAPGVKGYQRDFHLESPLAAISSGGLHTNSKDR